MSESMIERVARAMWELDQARAFHEQSNLLLFGEIGPISWEKVTSADVVPMMADQFRENARAAIQAMREPPEQMKKFEAKDGNIVIWDAPCNHCGGAKFTWQAMIDAALSESAEPTRTEMKR